MSTVTSRSRCASVEVGASGATADSRKVSCPPYQCGPCCRIHRAVIPWPYVDLLENVIARRVKLNDRYRRGCKSSSSDIANIVGRSAPAEREARCS